MAKKIKEKASFGTVTVDNFSPKKTDAWPNAINVTLSFEEALKLQLGLQHALLELNKLNRATTAGRRTGVNLCVWTEGKITINRGQVKK
jgi:hypothetical protein